MAKGVDHHMSNWCTEIPVYTIFSAFAENFLWYLSLETDREAFLDQILCRKKDLSPMISIHVVEPIPPKFDFIFVTPFQLELTLVGMY